MLLKSRLDRWGKLEKLSRMATDDIILPRTEPSHSAAPYSIPRNNPGPGVYRSRLPNGKYTNLMQVMFTDFCKMDCHFCPNSHWVPRKRFGFKVDELARTFIDLVERQTVDGLFLSSGVAGTGSKTTERMVKVVDKIRNGYGYKGYVHLKVMPGTERNIVEAAHQLGTRLSVNLETATGDHMDKLSKMKHYERDIMAPMAWIDQLKRGPTQGAIGQATQFVVGAANETDADILNRITQLYSDWNLKRVYYSPFRPVRYTPLEEHPATPMQRTNRLYQLDWLKRVYRYTSQEISNAFDRGGFLPLEMDPKQSIALGNLEMFPIDLNAAPREQLIRTPGLGPISVDRIIKNRRRFKITRWRDLQHMGVVRKRAWPFVTFPGHRPQPARQLRFDSEFHQERMDRTDGGFADAPTRKPSSIRRTSRASLLMDDKASWNSSSTAANAASTPCGVQSSCSGCSLYGSPGHPGASNGAVKYIPSSRFIASQPAPVPNH